MTSVVPFTRTYTFLAPAFLLLLTFVLSCDDSTYNDVLDVTNPYVISYNPVSSVDGVALNSNLVITFDVYLFMLFGYFKVNYYCLITTVE